MDGGFFRGTSADQDSRFANKQKKLLKSTKFANGLDTKINMKKVNMETLKPWISKRTTELLGYEDDVIINFIFNNLEEQYPDPKVLQINLTGFLNSKNSRQFLGELWPLLTSAQNNPTGIPDALLQQKKEGIMQRQLEFEKLAILKQSIEETCHLKDKEREEQRKKDHRRSRSNSDDRHYSGGRRSRSRSPRQYGRLHRSHEKHHVSLKEASNVSMKVPLMKKDHQLYTISSSMLSKTITSDVKHLPKQIVENESSVSEKRLCKGEMILKKTTGAQAITDLLESEQNIQAKTTKVLKEKEASRANLERSSSNNNQSIRSSSKFSSPEHGLNKSRKYRQHSYSSPRRHHRSESKSSNERGRQRLRQSYRKSDCTDVKKHFTDSLTKSFRKASCSPEGCHVRDRSSSGEMRWRRRRDAERKQAENRKQKEEKSQRDDYRKQEEMRKTQQDGLKRREERHQGEYESRCRYEERRRSDEERQYKKEKLWNRDGIFDEQSEHSEDWDDRNKNKHLKRRLGRESKTRMREPKRNSYAMEYNRHKYSQSPQDRQQRRYHNSSESEFEKHRKKHGKKEKTRFQNSRKNLLVAARHSQTNRQHSVSDSSSESSTSSQSPPPRTHKFRDVAHVYSSSEVSSSPTPRKRKHSTSGEQDPQRSRSHPQRKYRKTIRCQQSDSGDEFRLPSHVAKGRKSTQAAESDSSSEESPPRMIRKRRGSSSETKSSDAGSHPVLWKTKRATQESSSSSTSSDELESSAKRDINKDIESSLDDQSPPMMMITSKIRSGNPSWQSSRNQEEFSSTYFKKRGRKSSSSSSSSPSRRREVNQPKRQQVPSFESSSSSESENEEWNNTATIRSLSTPHRNTKKLRQTSVSSSSSDSHSSASQDEERSLRSTALSTMKRRRR